MEHPLAHRPPARPGSLDRSGEVDPLGRVETQLAKTARRDQRWRFLPPASRARHASAQHLVVGPGGVFALTVTHHRGERIWVGGDAFLADGRRWPHIQEARLEASRSAVRLGEACGFPVHVSGLVVPAGAAGLTVKTPSDDVWVVPRLLLARWLLTRPTVLEDPAVAAICAAASARPGRLAAIRRPGAGRAA